ncbi:hypothetical protein BJS_08986 [Bradyrhizobium japonicum SEMIA 5079]|nr:hypothetical protein BJS_08986 [Bradyrhizobium japonicum SEMIA 5079]
MAALPWLFGLGAGEGCGPIARCLRDAPPFAVSSPGSDRAIQYAETAVVESMGRGVLDSPPARGMTGRVCYVTARDGYRSPKIPG